MSRKQAPTGADDVLDGIVRTLGREASRIETRSARKALKPRDVFLLVQIAGAVTKVVEQQANPFGPAFTARLKRMSDEDLELAKRRLMAIETTAE